LALLDSVGFFLSFFDFLGWSFLNKGAFGVYFNFAATWFPGCADFSGGVDKVRLFLFAMGGSFEFLAHRFG
jgi:hypothetical protein